MAKRKTYGYKPVKKKGNVFPEVPAHRKVAIACLFVKGAPSVMFTVDKYAKGWLKTYKSYEAALKDRPYVTLWR